MVVTTTRTTTTTTTLRKTRREWLRLGGAIVSAPCFAETPSIEEQCRSGALAAEQAVPGAYQQVCMALPVRKIPVQTTTTTTTSSTSDSKQKTTTTIELEVEQQATGAGSTGTVVWNSSLLLTRLMERLAAADNDETTPKWIAGQTVLELGCGTGLVSLAAAALGARSVIATDGNPNVVELAARNIARNREKLLTARGEEEDTTIMEATYLPWGLLPAMDYADAADLVVGSDLTYFSGNWPALAETMATVTKRKEGIVLYLSLGHSGFNVNAELQGFLSVAAGYGLMPVVGIETLSERYLTNLLYKECLTPNERDMVSSSGGARVIALMRKY